MRSEIGGIQQTVIACGPKIRCGCSRLCGVIAAIGRGDIPSEGAEQALLIATQTDLSGGIKMSIENGGKFVPENIGNYTTN